MHTNPGSCFHCGISDVEKPLLLLHYQKLQICICPQCLPALIHHPERLAESLAHAALQQPPFQER